MIEVTPVKVSCSKCGEVYLIEYPHLCKFRKENELLIKQIFGFELF